MDLLRKFAYFSMEVGINENMPTYSGGLGVLAGDTLKSCADMKIPLVAITLLSESGFFYQKLDDYGNQSEKPQQWSKDDFCVQLPSFVTVKIEGRDVRIGAWRYNIVGEDGFIIPLFLLDTNIEGNSDYDRNLTRYLYGGDHRYRLHQEIILGIGGMLMLDILGFSHLEKYHMNEGHASFAAIELLRQLQDGEKVRDHFLFTTHTPVPAGHDQFHRDEIFHAFSGTEYLPLIEQYFEHDFLNMTTLALRLSKFVNGVAKKHQEVSQLMFPHYKIQYITNGIHSASWASSSFVSLFDKYIPDWKEDPTHLRIALTISDDEIWNAHVNAKKNLLDFVNEVTNIGMDYDVFTIGFARRSATYKRSTLLFLDAQRLIHIAEKFGKIQVIFSGKAHPNDQPGKDLIRYIFSKKEELKDKIKIAYLENYDIHKGKLLTSGVDLWLNTPRRPHEASGTSGMKACLNAVPSFSTLDGWWIEGHIEGQTGWSIGNMVKTFEDESDDYADAQDLYHKLETSILPLFYKDRSSWIRIMKYCIAFNASYFNTHRMVSQYITKAYMR